MTTYSISHAKTHLLKLLDQFNMRKEPFIITKRGKPIAKVEPYKEEKSIVNVSGLLKDTVIEEKDILTPFGEEEWELKI